MSLLCLRPAETPPKGTKAAPRRPGPEPRPVSPDWAAAARRTPDPSRRAATFDPGTAQILRTFRDGCGDLFKLVALRPVRRDGTGRPKHAEPVPVLRQEVNRSGRFCLRSNWFWDFLLTFVVKVFTVPTMFCSFSPGHGGAQRSEVISCLSATIKPRLDLPLLAFLLLPLLLLLLLLSLPCFYKCAGSCRHRGDVATVTPFIFHNSRGGFWETGGSDERELSDTMR